MPQSVVETAPAKINLALHVTSRRADGYHDLESLVVFADMADELYAKRAGTDCLHVTGPFAPALTHGQTNLVQKAVALFRQHFPDRVAHGVDIELRKNLPVSAGIGGGSADAAAALRLMANLAGGMDLKTLEPLAAKLGADVPVCLYSTACLVEGLGEKVKPLKDFPQAFLLLANPLVPVPTADVFRKLKSRDNPGLIELPHHLSRISMWALWLGETRNDLEDPALEVAPVIGELKAAIAKTRGCILSRMSGSGATVFGLYGSSAEAFQGAQDIRAKWPDFWVAAAPLTEQAD